jgi:hypothetical protein
MEGSSRITRWTRAEDGLEGGVLVEQRAGAALESTCTLTVTMSFSESPRHRRLPAGQAGGVALRGTPFVGTYGASMTTEPDGDPVEPAQVRAARSAIEAYLSGTGAEGNRLSRSAGGPPGPSEPATGGPPAGGDRRIDDATAERIAREAWDAVSAVTPPPPDPGSDPGPARTAKEEEPAEVTERRRHAVAVVRGLQLLGYHLDETLLPGPDMAAG